MNESRPFASPTSRREFLAALTIPGVASIAHALRAPALHAETGFPRVAATHPTPRPGITAAKVLPREQLGDAADAIPVFDMVREIPGVVDGIRCNCGCGDSPDFYSLLSCYEGEDAMAKQCHICQGQGRLAYRLHREGKSLDEIRTAIDKKYG
jgi:hypothetical protein